MDGLLETGILALLGPGILIWLGFVLVFCKLALKTKLRWLAYPLLLDIVVAAVAFWLHGGATYTGGMAATVAGIITAISTAWARTMFGYIQGGTYYPGVISYNPEKLR